MTNINIKLDETKENTDMCQAMQEIIEDVRKEYIEENNKIRAAKQAALILFNNNIALAGIIRQRQLYVSP